MTQISERKRVTLQFFEQLKEPERSEAIENFDESFDRQIPDCLVDALDRGFNFDNTKQGHKYWFDITLDIESGRYLRGKKKPFDIKELAREMYPTDCLDRKVVLEVYNKLKSLGKIKE